jgi:hypothetical protein
VIRRICQWTDAGRCSQCGKSMSRRTCRDCKAWPGYATSRQAFPLAIFLAGLKQWLENKPVRGRCAYLGGVTGEHVKRSCGNNFADVYECYHFARRWFSRRRKGWRAGKCLPKGHCQDAALVQPCVDCQLWQARQRLAVDKHE